MEKIKQIRISEDDLFKHCKNNIIQNSKSTLLKKYSNQCYPNIMAIKRYIAKIFAYLKSLGSDNSGVEF